LQVVLWATRGQHTLEELAGLAGRARSTIQVWLDNFTQGGLTQLLAGTIQLSGRFHWVFTRSGLKGANCIAVGQRQ
jgi:hypothetical protein